MAPHSNYDEEEDIDFSDLREQYEVRLDEGLDTFVVVDGCPKVPEDSKAKLVKFLCKKLSDAGKVKPEGVFMPLNEETGQTEGYAFVEYETPEQALAACKKLSGLPLDKKHTIYINKLTDIEHFGREGKVKEEYVEPAYEPFVEQEHLRSWLEDPSARDQMIMFRGDSVGVFWNKKKDTPEQIVDRVHWTESFVQWSPLGTYLTSIHAQGVQLWGGASWKRIRRFAHPFVNLVDYSPNENYLVTWSNKPITIPDVLPPNFPLTADEDGKNFIIWDIKTGKVIRSFASIEAPEAADKGRKKISWPSFKWSSDDKYVARVVPGQAVQVYQTPEMTLLGKKSIKIDGVVDFEWQPAIPVSGKGKPQTEQLFAYWTPEIGNQTARAGLMSVPSKEIVRTRNLVNVSDCKLHWQNEGKYLCVKVDRHTKTKKSNYTSLEFFRVTEKNIPVEIVELKQVVVNFSWEPKGDRFVFITVDEAVAGAAVAPKTNVHFYAPEKTKSGIPGEWMCTKTVEKKNSNAIYWAPKGRFAVIATVHSQQSFELEFWDFDFEGEKQKQEKAPANKDLACNLMLMATAEHYGVTDVEWDPTGRYVATSASFWKHQMENGYHLYDFKGQLLREEHIERFNQFLWRPRPPTMLTKEDLKTIRKNLREYSRQFDEEDEFEESFKNKEVVEARKRLLDEWRAWRERCERELERDRKEAGWTPPVAVEGGEETVVEEIVEEVIEEKEEEIQ
ncbi:eukaryotic translation initiation factor eIF2A-domain-containing protein [Sphaerosporella brunnea]|uniref:Eukaryotic translation initiation factor 3 subunit B n=1 Tax=Sphaerosporella brunnea TaxID=1250544 RepID=A0A5J5F3V4_9PEZI|nr:eukaryotic translation initiation factor eIF2A-domain-containing protein [Sphaerosporella brunnea]